MLVIWAYCARYPFGVQGATGALINGQPVICGGLDAGGNTIDDCYILIDNQYVPFATMSTTRWTAASVIFRNSLFLSGGRDGSGNTLKSTEFISQGESKPGPSLRVALENHAMVLWNNSLMVIGGSAGGDKKQTWVLSNNQWVPGSPLHQGRDLHAAAVGADRTTQEQFIAVTGGCNGDACDNVEILWRGSTEWYHVLVIVHLNATES